MKRLAFATLKLCALIGCFLAPRRRGLTVFTLHRVLEDQTSEMVVQPTFFERLMTRLKEKLEPFDGDRFCGAMADPDFPHPGGLITVDDGFSDFYSTIFPVLRAKGVPVVLFVPTHFMNDPDKAPVSYAHDPALYRPCTWSQLREMQDSGLVEIGGHSHSHRELPTLSADELRADLEESHRIFESEGIRRPRFFAYPRGVFDAGSASVVAEYYEYAFAGSPQDRLPGELWRYAVPRHPIRGSDQRFFWRLKIAGYLDAEEALIKWLKGAFRTLKRPAHT